MGSVVDEEDVDEVATVGVLPCELDPDFLLDDFRGSFSAAPSVLPEYLPVLCPPDVDAMVLLLLVR